MCMGRSLRTGPVTRLSLMIGLALGVVAAARAGDGVGIAAPVHQVVQLAPVLVEPLPLPGAGIDAAMLPYVVQAASDQDMRKAQATNLAGFLADNLAGVNVNEVQGSPYQVDITYHGFRASPTLGAAQGISVYLDGVRVNEPFGDIVSWDTLPESSLASMTLVPGANPLFGPNTLGGALSLTTKSGLTDPGRHVDLSWGSYGRRKLDLSYGVSNADGWHAYLAGTHFDENGWRRDSPGQLGNLFLKVGRHTDANDWDLSAMHAASRLIGNGLLPGTRIDDDGGTAPGLYQIDRRAVYTVPDLTRNHVTQLTVHGSHTFDQDTLLSGLAYTRHSARDTVNGDVNDDYEDYVDDCGGGFAADGAPLDPGCDYTAAEGAELPTGVYNTTRTRQQTQGVALNLSHHGGAHRWVLGATFDRSQVTYQQFTRDGYLDGSRVIHPYPDAVSQFVTGVDGTARTASVFATDTWTMAADTFVTGALRWNRTVLDNALTTAQSGAQTPEHLTFAKLNPSLGIVHRIGSWRVFADASQSNRAPTVIELGCADPEQPCTLPTGLQADPPLKQVVARSYDAGVDWTPAPDARVSLSLYRTNNRDDILFLRAPNTQQGYFDNFPRTRNQGADVSYRQVLGAFSLRASYSFLQATYQAHGTLLAGERSIDVRPGMRIAGLPRHTFKAGLDWQATSSFSLGADLVAASRTVAAGNEDGRVDDDEPDLFANWSTAGYALVNLRASWRPRDHLEIYAHVDNVFDRRFESYAAVAEDILPDGKLIRPQVEPGEGAATRYLAPGAPRLAGIGIRVDY